MVISPEPFGGLFLSLFNRFKDALLQPLLADRPVVTFHIGILLWLSGLDILDADVAFLCPFRQRTTHIFGAVIDPNDLRLAAPFNDSVQAAHDPQGWQRKVHLNA